MTKPNKQHCILNHDKPDVLWEINPKDLDKKCKKHDISIHDALFKKVEYAGDFLLTREFGGTCTKKSGCNTVKFNSMNKGDNFSVKTKEGFCNFHTHPLSCYLGEGCIIGCPSGEDVRETIRFMLYGNVIHLIFTIEGIYTIQVNPNYIHILQNNNTFSNTERGLLVSLIETYFKSTHGFRNVEYNLQKSQKDRNPKSICTPNDWVTFANHFRLNNVISTSNKCTKNISCAGIPNYETAHARNITLKEYMKEYEMDCYSMTSSGDLRNSSNNNFKKVMESLKKHIKIFDQAEHKIKGWKRGQWFKAQFYENKFNGKPIIKHNKNLSVEWFQDMFKQIQRNPKLLSFPDKPIQFYFKDVSAPEGRSCVVKFKKKPTN